MNEGKYEVKPDRFLHISKISKIIAP